MTSRKKEKGQADKPQNRSRALSLPRATLTPRVCLDAANRTALTASEAQEVLDG